MKGESLEVMASPHASRPRSGPVTSFGPLPQTSRIWKPVPTAA